MKQVIAMGDGGLDGNNPYMDLYILAQAQKKNPKVCFLGTASGDNAGLTKFFYHVFGRYPCRTSSLELFHPHTPNIEDFIKSQDIIYVGGGQSKSMLGVWREWGLDRILKEAYENGTILAGGSAGSVCWFDQCITDSIPGSLTVMNCIGVLPFSNCPHFANYSRRAAYSRYIRNGQIKAGYAADDFAGLHFIDGELVRSISNRAHANAYKVSPIDPENNDVGYVFNGAVHERLRTEWLGLKENQEKLIFNSPLFDGFKRARDEEEDLDDEDIDDYPEEENISTAIVKVSPETPPSEDNGPKDDSGPVDNAS